MRNRLMDGVCAGVPIDPVPIWVNRRPALLGVGNSSHRKPLKRDVTTEHFVPRLARVSGSS